MTLDEHITRIELFASFISGSPFSAAEWSVEYGNATLRVESGEMKWALQAAVRDDEEKARLLVADSLLIKMAKEAGCCPGCQSPFQREKGQRRHRCTGCLHVWIE